MFSLSPRPETRQQAPANPAVWTGPPGSGILGGVFPLEAALQITVVQACIQLVSGQIARAPIYVEHPDGTSDAPPDWLLQPDPEETLADTISQMVMSLMLDGNAYAWITARDPGSIAPRSIMVLSPSEVGVTRPTPLGRREYRVNGEVVPSDRVIHVKGQCLPGADTGIGPIEYGARQMALSRAETHYATARFAPGDRGPGIPEYVVETDGKLTQEQADGIVKQIKESVTSTERGPVVLYGGAKAKVLEFSAAELELIVSRKFSDVQLCTLMGVQPHLVGVQVENSMTYSNVLMDQQGFKVFKLEDWANRLGAGLALRTLPRGDVFKFDLDELTRDLMMPGATLEIDGTAQTAKFTSQGAG